MNRLGGLALLALGWAVGCSHGVNQMAPGGPSPGSSFTYAALGASDVVGVEQARQAGRLLKEGGYEFDLAWTSVLKRATWTLWQRCRSGVPCPLLRLPL